MDIAQKITTHARELGFSDSLPSLLSGIHIPLRMGYGYIVRGFETTIKQMQDLSTLGVVFRVLLCFEYKATSESSGWPFLI